MTNHEGLITDLNRRVNKPMQVLDDPVEIFDVASVTVKDWDSAADSNISECHIYEYVHDKYRLSS